MLWQRFWLELCTKQVASARACANQFLPYSSSGIAMFGMRTMQADSCLNSDQIDTLFINVEGQEGGWGGGGIFGRRPRIFTCMSGCFFLRLLVIPTFSAHQQQNAPCTHVYHCPVGITGYVHTVPKRALYLLSVCMSMKWLTAYVHTVPKRAL